MQSLRKTQSAFPILLTVALICLPSPIAGDVGWRNDGTGRFPASNPPQQWSADQQSDENTTDKNIVWKVKLPDRSLASPVVVGQRILIQADPAELLCLDRERGELLWQRSHQYHDVFPADKADTIEADLAQAREIRKRIDELQRQRNEAQKAGDEDLKVMLEEEINKLRKQVDELQAYPQLPHGEPGNTGTTPTSDGSNVFAVFGTGIVSSHTLGGQQNWMTFVEAPGTDLSASPLLADGKLIVQLRRLSALDPQTGDILWQADTQTLHGSPVAAQLGDTPVVVTASGSIVRLSDGEILARNQFRLGHSSPLVQNGIIYAMEDGAIKALRLAHPEGDPAKLPVVWETESSRTNRLASPCLADGLLYGTTEQGILEVTDAETGKLVYRKRLDFDGGRVDPSICLAGGLIYISSNRGITIVLRPGRKYAEVARNTLADESSSSLAFADDQIFVRGRKYLWCISQ